MKTKFDESNEVLSSIKIELTCMTENELLDLAINSSVSINTLKNWRYGIVEAPQVRTLLRVLSTLGYDLKLTRKRKKRLSK